MHKRQNTMKPRQIYGLLMVSEVTAQEIADDLGVSLALVQRVINGTRGTGFTARHVRAHIAKVLGKTVDELWPEEQAAA